jgi:hypothetical protein
MMPNPVLELLFKMLAASHLGRKRGMALYILMLILWGFDNGKIDSGTIRAADQNEAPGI